MVIKKGRMITFSARKNLESKKLFDLKKYPQNIEKFIYLYYINFF